MIRRPPRSTRTDTLFPYTTLFRSTAEVQHGPHSLVSTILNLVPSNVFAAIAHGDILPIIFFSVLFGLALSSLPAGHRDPLVQTFRSIARSEERRVGKECVSTCRYGLSPYH